MTKETGGPAFPEIRIINGDNYNPPKKLYYGGMTLRDYFAAKVLQAYMASEIWREDVYKDAAEESYKVADAMLKAREQ